MEASIRESSIVDMGPTAYVGSNHFFKKEFDKCAQIIKDCCTNIVKALENAALSLDGVQELKIIQWKMLRDLYVAHLQKWACFHP